MVEGIDSIAGRQFGLITRAQACTAGLSFDAVDRRLASGRWAVVHPRVYRLEGAPITWEQQLMAACLWAGPGAMVSHRAAGALWRLDGLREAAVEITTGDTQRLRSPHVRVHQSRDLVRGDFARLRGIPVASLARTLLDLSSQLDPEPLELAFEDAIRKRRTMVPWLDWRLKQGTRGHDGASTLRSLVEVRLRQPSKDESALETRLRLFMRKHRLPEAVQQFELTHRGQFVGRIDFSYPELRYAIETDGRRDHDAREQFELDRRRWNGIQVAGWTLVVITWRELHERPEQALSSIRRGYTVACARRGVTGLPLFAATPAPLSL